MALNTLTELKRILGQDQKSRVRIMTVTKVDGEEVTVQSQESTFLTRTTLPKVLVGDDVIVSDRNIIVGHVSTPSTVVLIT